MLPTVWVTPWRMQACVLRHVPQPLPHSPLASPLSADVMQGLRRTMMVPLYPDRTMSHSPPVTVLMHRNPSSLPNKRQRSLTIAALFGLLQPSMWPENGDHYPMESLTRFLLAVKSKDGYMQYASVSQ